jgi:hypothetical protein
MWLLYWHSNRPHPPDPLETSRAGREQLGIVPQISDVSFNPLYFMSTPDITSSLSFALPGGPRVQPDAFPGAAQ